jgi:hypothetical protein
VSLPLPFDRTLLNPQILAWAESVAREADAVRLENASHLATIDALTRTALNASDSPAVHQLAVGVRAVHAMLRNVTGKVALGQDERPYVDSVKAWLVENGSSVYEADAPMREAFREWESKR